MKRQQLTAVLLSMVLSVSACMPLTGIRALASEDNGDQTIQTELGEIPAGEGIDQETSAGGEEGTETPAGENVATDPPAGEENAAEDPEGENVATDPPAGEENVAEDPAGNNAATEPPAGEENAAEDPEGENVATEPPAGEENVAEAPAGEGIYANPDDQQSPDGMNVPDSSNEGDIPDLVDSGEPAASEVSEGALYGNSDAGGSGGYNPDASGSNLIDAWPEIKSEGVHQLDLYADLFSQVDLAVSVSAQDSEELTYLWYRDTIAPNGDYTNHELIEGAEDSLYVIESVDNRYAYTCTVTDQYGFSVDVTFNIYVGQAIEMHPSEKEVGDTEDVIYVSPGETANLSVSVTADYIETLSYEWYEIVHDENGDNWNQLEGVSGTSCSFGPVTRGENVVKCVASDSRGNSREVTFYINIQENLTAYPAGCDQNEVEKYIQARRGESVPLEVAVITDDPDGVTYQWSKSFVNEEDTSDWAIIDGAEGCTYTTEALTEDSTYRCVVRGRYGTEKNVTFHIYAHWLTAYPEGGEEGSDTADLTIAPGSYKTLKAIIESDTNELSLTFEWYDNNHNRIENAYDSSYTTGRLFADQSYFCRVFDPYGNSVEITFTLSLLENEFTAYADAYDSAPELETTQTFHVITEGVDPSDLTYEWYSLRNNRVFRGNINNAVDSLTTVIDGETTGYCCVIYAQDGRAAYVMFDLELPQPDPGDNNLEIWPGVDSWETGGEEVRARINVEPGQEAVLTVHTVAYDISQLNFVWTHYDDEGTSEVVQEGQDNFNSDSGTCFYNAGVCSRQEKYSCTVSDQYGNNGTIFFYITVDNSLKLYPQGQGGSIASLSVGQNETVDLYVTAEATDTSQLTYEWLRMVNGSYELVNGALTNTLTSVPVTSREQYCVNVYDQYGNCQSAEFTLYLENHFLVYPEGNDPDYSACTVKAAPGADVTLRACAQADDMEGITWEWINPDGDIIDGENTDTYTAVNIDHLQAYKCIGTDKYGNTSYAFFEVMVDSGLKAWPEGGAEGDISRDLYVSEGDTVTLRTIASAADGTGLTYEWYGPDGGLIEGESSDSYTTGPILYEENYDCVVRDQYGNRVGVSFNVMIGEGPAKKSIEEAEIRLSQFRYVYDGNPKTPEVTVTLDGNMLTKDKDYTVAYYDNINAGEGMAVARGIGDYIGTCYEYIWIEQASQTLKAKDMWIRKDESSALNVSGYHTELTYESSNPDVASVDEAGTVTGHDAGEAQITITALSDDNYYESSVTVNVTVEVQHQVTIVSDQGCRIAAYVIDPDAGDDNGNLISSGDYVKAGSTVRVEASVNTGYRWKDGQSDPSGSYTVDQDLTIDALTEQITYKLNLTPVNGSAPSCTAQDMNAVPYHSTVTVTAADPAEGYEFTGWYQTNGKRLTEEISYTVLMISDLTLEARYQAKTGVVTFVSNDNIQKTLTDVSSVTTDDYPGNPSPLYGYEFEKWDQTAEEINSKLRNGENVLVNAVFVPVKTSIEVTIYNGESDTPEVRTLTESSVVTVTAREVENKNFAYWKQDGQILTYTKTASIRAAASCELRAIYTEQQVEARGTATIKSASYNPETEKLSFVAYLTVPEDAVIDAAGLVSAHVDSSSESPSAASNAVNGKAKASAGKASGTILKGTGNNSGYDPEQELSIENADYVKSLAKAVGKSTPVNYTWTKTAVKPGDIWLTRAYVTYRSGDEITTIYGDCLTTSAGEDYDSSEKGTATIKSTSYNPSTQKATFVAYLAVPEGGIITKAGLVASSAGHFDPAAQVLTSANADYVKSLALAEGKSTPVNYTWNKTKVNSGDTWYARAWLVYTDTAGTEHTVYGSLTKLTAE